MYETVDLAEYVRAIWRGRFAMITGTLLGGLAALGVSLLMRPQYEATTTIGISRNNEDKTTNRTFQALLENRSLGTKVLTELGLDKPPYNLTVEQFIDEALEVEEVPDTSLLIVRVRASDPKLAARATERLSALAIEMNEQLADRTATTKRSVLKRQLDEAKDKLVGLEAKLVAFKDTAQIELTRKSVEALLEQRGTLSWLLVELAAERTRLASAEAELKQRKPTVTVQRSIDRDVPLMEAVRENSGSTQPMFGVALKDEFINPVYEELEKSVTTMRTSVAGMERQQRELTQRLSPDSPQFAQMSRLNEREVQLAEIERQVTLARTLHNDLFLRHEQARIESASASQLSVLDPPQVPVRPVSPRIVLNTALGLILGFMLTITLLLVRQFVRLSGSRTPSVAS